MKPQDPLALPDNKTLLDFLDALFEHSLPESLRWYTIIYLGLRVTLFCVVAGLILCLLKRRRFWLFRLVKVEKGKIICPNACEGLLFFALVFYVCDSVYRALTLSWYWNTSSKQNNIILFTGMRLFPLWTAGFVHVIAIGFLGPVSPARVNPHLYHCFLFGAPIALVLSTMLSLVPANDMCNKANVLFQQMRADLASKPGSDLISMDDLAILLQISASERKMFNHFRDWAVTGAIFNVTLMLMHAVAGSALASKIYSALRRQKLESEKMDAEGGSVKIQQGSLESRKHHTTFSTASTSVDSDQSSLEEPTEKSKRNVLLEFLIFTVAETLCLVSIGAVMLGAIIYLTTTLIANQRYEHNLPLYREKLIKVGFRYQLIEMGAVLVFGTPLMIMILYRHCFPVKVELKKSREKVSNIQQRLSSSNHKMQPSRSNGGDLRIDVSIDTSQLVVPLPKSPFEQESPVHQKQRGSGNDRKLESQASQEIVRDACAYAGGCRVGRSIILDALDTGNMYPRRRKRASPWDVVSQSSTFTDMDPSGGGKHLYATPNGVVESIPLSPVAASPDGFFSRR